MTHPSALTESQPTIMKPMLNVFIRNLTFENLTVGGKPVSDSEFFKTNEFVDGLNFVP